MNDIKYIEQFAKCESTCIFCGKKGRESYFDHGRSMYYICDCEEYSKYHDLYYECYNKLEKYAEVAKARKTIIECEKEMDKLKRKKKTIQNEINEINCERLDAIAEII